MGNKPDIVMGAVAVPYVPTILTSDSVRNVMGLDYACMTRINTPAASVGKSPRNVSMDQPKQHVRHAMHANMVFIAINVLSVTIAVTIH